MSFWFWAFVIIALIWLGVIVINADIFIERLTSTIGWILTRVI